MSESCHHPLALTAMELPFHVNKLTSYCRSSIGLYIFVKTADLKIFNQCHIVPHKVLSQFGSLRAKGNHSDITISKYKDVPGLKGVRERCHCLEEAGRTWTPPSGRLGVVAGGGRLLTQGGVKRKLIEPRRQEGEPAKKVPR